MKNKLSESIKNYFKNTPPEIIKKDWEEFKEWDNILGATVLAYLFPTIPEKEKAFETVMEQEKRLNLNYDNKDYFMVGIDFAFNYLMKIDNEK